LFSNSNDTIEVNLTLASGEIMAARMVMGNNATIQGVLSYHAPFIEIIGKDGQKRYISKQAIAIIEPVEKLKKPVLDPRIISDSDPFQVLKVPKGSEFSVVRHAYLDLAKKYHPDTYSKLILPREVEQYIGDMFRLINAAFVEIKQEMKPPLEDQAA
jgi:DnaJ-domain-containing protein 1